MIFTCIDTFLRFIIIMITLCIADNNITIVQWQSSINIVPCSVQLICIVNNLHWTLHLFTIIVVCTIIYVLLIAICKGLQ